MTNTEDLPIYLFHEGTNTEAYDLMCPAPAKEKGKDAWRFRVWAPSARSVSIVGDFNEWNRNANPMKKISVGIWEGTVIGAKEFDCYKYSIETKLDLFLKSDPYALHAETAPANASKLYDINGYSWHDKNYIQKRDATLPYDKPINVYEVHFGSWKRNEDGSYYSYKKLAEELIPYVKNLGYTHIEIMPISEHPFEGSWGYQVTGMFAPTSRYGTPKDFMHFVDKCHEEGIGVILDFVPAHFPKDAHGLYRFDGGPLYEYDDPTRAEHKEWGTMVFDYGRNEVRSFLCSAACFWCDKYHIDGLRVDAVASMLYLDYNRKKGEWIPNVCGGNYNLEAISFLKMMNTSVLTKFQGVMTIAEESTAFPMITKPPKDGGLGFSFKWNMGWMNDTLDYISTDGFFKKGVHNKLTFSLTYAFSENYFLPFSHDEVVHGKKSLIGRIPSADYKEKFEGLKTLFGYQIGHPGKKLNFMGNEFGQFIEWNYSQGLDFLLLDYDMHKKMLNFSKDLNKLYKKLPPLYELDGDYNGFRWVVVDDKIQNIIAFNRYDKQKNAVLFVINFSGETRENYEIGVEKAGNYKIIFDSSLTKYGGNTKKTKNYVSVKKQNHGYENTIKITLNRYSFIMIEFEEVQNAISI